MENKFYVYVHRRLDSGEPFYIGKGSGRRAWSSCSRNSWWTNIVNKHGFDVEIVVDKLNEKSAFDLEKKLILLFKKLNYNISNLSEGGEGPSGYKYEGEKLERLRAHIREQCKRRSDPSVYTFYHLTGESFSGTRMEFCKKYNILSKEVAKLFQSKNKRNLVKNWSLFPVEITVPKKKELTCPQRRSSNVDKKVYLFYHVLGDTFLGTRSEFSDYSQIALSKIASLFCKNPKRSLFGWSLNKMQSEDHTHMKI